MTRTYIIAIVSFSFLSLFLWGCGGSDKPAADGETDDGSIPDVVDTITDGLTDSTTDTPAEVPDVVADTAEEDVVEVGCTTDADCDDELDCTTDTCGDDGECVSVPDDGSCTDAQFCDPVLGCVECVTDAECDDSVDCTIDECSDGYACTNTADDGECTAGLVCSETLGCVACLDDGACDDAVDCTTDSCDAAGACVFTPDDTSCMGELVCSDTLGCVQCLDDAGCDDGLFCTGVETCDSAGDCIDGSTPCDDTISCTNDTCDEDTDSCSATPNDSRCDDGLYCTGLELCVPLTGDPTTGCVAGTDVVCDDTVGCTRDECSEADLGACNFIPVHTTCDVMAGEICDPALDCVVIECTGDGECDNGLACDGVETCVDFGCVGGTPIVCDDGVDCTTDSCSEPTGSCVFTAIHGFCEDPLVCNGAETCDPATGDPTTGCVAGTPPTCIDTVDCTIDSCSEAAGGCQFLPDDGSCEDPDLCNGAETCNVVTGCVAGVPVDCDDIVGCTDDSCIPLTGTCEHLADDGECEDEFICNGAETCDLTLDCQPGTPVVCDDTVACTVDVCEEPGTCAYSPDHTLCSAGEVCSLSGCVAGTTCTLPADCDDGQYCNGAEICDTGNVCAPGAPIDCDDLNDCTVDACSESLSDCTHTPRDLDGDGYGDELCGGDDCSDTNPDINPGATEICDGIDNDCDGDFDFGLLADGWACSDGAECCSGHCAGGICTVGWGTCEGIGEICATSAECCSGRCEVGPGGLYTCVAGGACTLLGASCDYSAECCSTLCSGGVCALGTCAIEGESCTDSEECCSNNCDGVNCDDAGVSCEPEGELCTSDGNCCSGFCDPTLGQCVQNTICSPAGSICVDNADCCTGFCEYDSPTDDSGTCLFLGACTTVGSPCSGGGECCSLACADPGIGYTICLYLSGCRPIGELCNTTSDCCSGLCDPDGPVNRCSNPPGCQPDGEMCGIAATNNCCNGKSDGCRPTLAGVSRCFGSPVGGCLIDGAVCSFSDECCCGLCADDGAGTMVCCPGGISCVVDGDPCTADADCCSGSCNMATGLCGADETPCDELVATCLVNEDCCSGYCLDGYCATPP